MPGLVDTVNIMVPARLAYRHGDLRAALLAAGVEQPGERLSQLDLLSPDELAFLGRWNQRAAPFARDACLHQLFERHFARAPQRLALVHGASTLTYAELETRSNTWAHRLQSLGVGPDVLVAICLERSIDMVVAILATLKAGGRVTGIIPKFLANRERMLKTVT